MIIIISYFRFLVIINLIYRKPISGNLVQHPAAPKPYSPDLRRRRKEERMGPTLDHSGLQGR